MHRLLFVFGLFSCTWAQPLLPLHPLGQIGDLNSEFRKQKTIRYDAFTITGLPREPDSPWARGIQVTGRDKSGKAWRILLQSGSYPLAGPSVITAATGDLDQDGQQDLLVYTAWASSGWCNGEGDLQIFFMDNQARPRPRVLRGLIATRDLKGVPIPVALDHDSDGRAEFATATSRHGVGTWWIDGVWEAEAADLQRLKPSQVERRAYARVMSARTRLPVRANAGTQRYMSGGTFRPKSRDQFPEMNWDNAQPTLVLKAVGNDRPWFRLSNGQPIESALAVVVDKPEGREINAAESGIVLQQARKSKRPVRVIGPPWLEWDEGGFATGLLQPEVLYLDLTHP